MKSRIQRVTETFQSRFGHPPALIVRVPGRVNLIGEHTDYNGGYVLPIALEHDILAAASPREDNGVSLYAMQFAASSEFSLDLIRHSRFSWTNYIRGVVAAFRSNYAIQGFNAVFDGSIPLGAGLASSAALEVAFAMILKSLNNLELSPLDLAKLALRAENEFVGVQCGILDPYASLFAQKGQALLLNCKDYSSRPVPLALDRYGLKLVLAHSGVTRVVLESDYNVRRAECEEGNRLLGTLLRRPIRALCEVSVPEFTSLVESLPEVICKRSWHVLSENQRVLEAVEAIQRGDFSEFGQLMNHSHESLRDDFEISCPEVDLLVDLAQGCPGVLGSRMTGAGFGGCTVSLVKASALDAFRARVIEPYQRRTGHRAEMMVISPLEGASYLA